MRIFMRLVLMPFPGFSDHVPCDYERALRQEMPALQAVRGS